MIETKNDKTTELSPYCAPTPMTLIQAAMEQGCEPERLEKLMDLQERWDAKELRESERAAEIAYNQAMSAAQAEIQPVQARLKNTQTNSLYADICAIDDAIRPVYTRHGFALCEGSKKSELDGHIYVYIDVLHSGGHAKKYGDDFPIDAAGIKGSVNKTPIHAKASTTTYARRYLTMGLFNIAIARLDRDGNRSTKPITEIQAIELLSLLSKCDPDSDVLERLKSFTGVDDIRKVPSHKFDQTKLALEKLGKEKSNEGI